jgi:hypothetical protein
MSPTATLLRLRALPLAHPEVDPVDRPAPSPVQALAALARDQAVTRLVARVRRDSGGREAAVVEVTRAGRVATDPSIQAASELEEAIAALLGPGRSAGSVSIRALHGLAALPPASETPVLVLERPSPLPRTPDADASLPPGIVDLAGSLLQSGASVVIAGPPGAPLPAALRAVCGRLGSPSARLVAIEDGPPTPLSHEAVRLRDVPTGLLRSLRRVVAVINVAQPPDLTALACPSLVAVTARSPEAALARLCAPHLPPAVQARLCADSAPLLLWLGAHDGAASLRVYEILPHPDAAGLPALQLLAATEPSGSLIATGAVPRDPLLMARWREL